MQKQTQYLHYNPFGMYLSGKTYTNPTRTTANKYLYNGKELQNDFELQWYDYGFRMYDPQLCRFPSIDPKAEKYFSISPFVYVANNPINNIDPDGRDIYIGYQTQEEKKYKRGERKGQVKTDRNGNTKYRTRTEYQKYEVGMDGIGNKFADNVISSLNTLNTELGKTDNEFSSMISDIAGDRNVNLLISAGTSNKGDAYTHNRSADGTKKGEISWNPSAGIVGDILHSQTNTDRIPPIIGLGHEIGHAMFDFYSNLSNDVQHSSILTMETKLAKQMGYGSRSTYDSWKTTYRANSPTGIKGNEYGKYILIFWTFQKRKFRKGK